MVTNKGMEPSGVMGVHGDGVGYGVSAVEGHVKAATIYPPAKHCGAGCPPLDTLSNVEVSSFFEVEVVVSDGDD